MPSWRPTASAVVLPSPVSMTTRTPAAFSACSACGVVALMGSAIATKPASLPPMPTKMTVAAFWRCAFGGAARLADVDAVLGQELARCPRRRPAPSTVPMTPLPTGESKSVTGDKRKLALLRVHHDGHAPAGARWRARRWRASAARRRRRSRCAGSMWTTFGRPSVSVPVLSTHQRVDLLHLLERLGIADEHAVLRALADADHDGHRRGQAQRTGTGDDEHGHRRDERVAERRRRAPDQPGRRRSAPPPG